MEKISKFNMLKNIWSNYKVPLSVAGGTAALAGGGAYAYDKVKTGINTSIDQGIQKAKTALSDSLNDPSLQNRVNQLASSGAESALQSLSDRIFTLPNMGKIMAVGTLATLPAMLMGATSSRSPSISVNAGQTPQRPYPYTQRHRRYRSNYNPSNYYSFRAAR